MAQKRTTLRGWKKPEDGKSSACRLISSFVCIFGGIKWGCSKSLTIDCAEQPSTLTAAEPRSNPRPERQYYGPSSLRDSPRGLRKAGASPVPKVCQNPIFSCHWD